MIERLYIQNFRCFESFTLDLAGCTSALLIGKNGVGKSTVRDALSILQMIGRGVSRADLLISEKDFSQHRTDRPIRFEIELKLPANRFKYIVAFEWYSGDDFAGILEEGLWVDAEMVFKRELAEIQLTGGSTFRLDWQTFALSIIEPTPGKFWIRDFKNYLRQMILIAPIPDNMSGFSEKTTFELAHDASNFASCLRALLEFRPAAYGSFESCVKAAIPDFSSIENVPRGKLGYQLTIKFGESLTVEFRSLSSGEKCIFLSSYIIALKTAGVPVLCMWDEPDNHLSISEVGQFIMELRKMANRSGQFVATTHHPETIRKFSDENTIVLTRKTHTDPTLPRFLSEFNYDGDLVSALVRDEIIG
jgi:predicted ATPase